MQLLVILNYFLLDLVTFTASYSSSDATNLHAMLFNQSTYNKNVIPNDSMEIKVRYNLQYVNSLVSITSFCFRLTSRLTIQHTLKQVNKHQENIQTDMDWNSLLCIKCMTNSHMNNDAIFIWLFVIHWIQSKEIQNGYQWDHFHKNLHLHNCSFKKYSSLIRSSSYEFHTKEKLSRLFLTDLQTPLKFMATTDNLVRLHMMQTWTDQIENKSCLGNTV